MKKVRTGKLTLVIIVLIGLVSGFVLVKHDQDIRDLAKVPDNIGQVTVKVTKSSPEATRNKVEIVFKAVTANNETEAVSTISFRLNFPEVVKIMNEEGEEMKGIIPNNELSGSWEFPVNITAENNNKTHIDFTAVNTTKEGYASLTETSLATFYFDKGYSMSEAVFNFDPELSLMYSKRRPVTDIWTAQMPGSYQVLVR